MTILSALHHFAIRRPFHVCILAALVVAAVAPGVLRLELRTDGHALVPVDDPVVRYDGEVRDRFAMRDLMVVLIRTERPRGIFNEDTLRFVERLTRAAQTLPGVRPHDVFSIATELSDKVYTGTLNFRPLLDPFPTTDSELEALRETMRAFRVYHGTLVSSDGKATAVMVGVPSGADRTELYVRLRDLIEAEAKGTGDEIHVLGAPVAEALLGTHILEDLGVPPAFLGEHQARAAESGGPAVPYLESVRRFIARHVGLVPIVIVVMGVVFFVTFRSATAAALPLLEVGIALAVVFGLMGWVGTPLYLTMAIMPVILCAMGVTDEIHVFAHYAERRRTHPAEDVRASARAAFDDMLPPVAKTSLTTAIGFVSFAFSSLPSVKAFGVWTAVGMIVCMLLSFTVIPALIVLLRPMARSGPMPGATQAGGSLRMAHLARGVLRARWAVLGLSAALIIVTPMGIRRINVQDSWINGFSPYSEYYRATQAFNDQFFGSHLLMLEADLGAAVIRGKINEADVGDFELRLPAAAAEDPSSLIGAMVSITRPHAATTGAVAAVGPPRWSSRVAAAERKEDRLVLQTLESRGSLRLPMGFRPGDEVEYEITSQRHASPDVLRRLADLATFVRGQEALTVGGVLGPSDYLATTSFIVMTRREEHRVIPDDPDRCAWLWEQYKRVRRTERFGQLIDAKRGRCLTTIFMKNANYRDTGELMRRIRDYERAELHPHGIRLSFAGDVAVSQAMIAAIVRTEVLSLSVSLLGILAVVVALHRSLTWGALCLLPCALAVAGNFAVMGWTGMPLGIATSMFAGMSLGIGVDFAIHLAHRYRRLRADGMAERDAAVGAVATTGVPIVVDAVAIALGFGALMLSQVPANAHLGALTVATILVALTATLGLLPILVTLRANDAARPANAAAI